MNHTNIKMLLYIIFNQVGCSASLMLTLEGLLRLMSLHLLIHSLFLIILVFIRGEYMKTEQWLYLYLSPVFRFKVVSSSILSYWAVHTPTSIHIHTHTLHACMHTNSRDSHQRICITLRLFLPFILLASGLRAKAHTHMPRLWWITVCHPFIPVANQLDFAELSIW